MDAFTTAAYAPGIAVAAATQGHFLGIPGFLEGRIAWLKTSFLWMMYRSGWATKPDQEGVLAVALRRPFFERLLAASVPTAAGRDDKGACRQSEVVLQWDPDHTPDGGKHARRAVQLGVRGGLRDDYISGQHIVSIEDITPFVREMRQRVQHAGAAAQGWCQLVTPAERTSEAMRGLISRVLACLALGCAARAIVEGDATTHLGAAACAVSPMPAYFQTFQAGLNLEQFPGACGRCIWVKGDTGAPFIVRVARDCPTCTSDGLYLSHEAFRAVTGDSESTPRKVSWDWAATCSERASASLGSPAAAAAATDGPSTAAADSAGAFTALAAAASRRLLRDESAAKEALEGGDGQPGYLTDWVTPCQDGRRRCPSLFLASWGFQCANNERDSCCRRGDGKDCTRLGRDYSGCKWEGMFAGLNGKQSLSWVKSNNIVAFYEAPNSRNRKVWGEKWAGKTLRIRNPDSGKTMEVTIYDTCDDADCDGCCTRNANQHGGQLVDLEHHTARRFWGGDVPDVARIQWQLA
ncbi:hypothetical protein C2E20_5787 [Micractinium conductrix]|uniref:Uncharacterized protein n=1 Tax=Micractinium conductrix TaxID=554055 RepID=A0A2P6V9D2_9CHLO|nr:hypothetical protein C2E20_5787 [Micractinium conductrix]PSC70685.1 hypothetical protein C2E20_5787 [Micractinium conductrix]|eukprot:PSC70684.1 hypothetical protein C2E20_5787 [Micractinium conductrix]